MTFLPKFKNLALLVTGLATLASAEYIDLSKRSSSYLRQNSFSTSKNIQNPLDEYSKIGIKPKHIEQFQEIAQKFEEQGKLPSAKFYYEKCLTKMGVNFNRDVIRDSIKRIKSDGFELGDVLYVVKKLENIYSSLANSDLYLNRVNRVTALKFAEFNNYLKPNEKKQLDIMKLRVEIEKKGYKIKKRAYTEITKAIDQKILDERNRIYFEEHYSCYDDNIIKKNLAKRDSIYFDLLSLRADLTYSFLKKNFEKYKTQKNYSKINDLVANIIFDYEASIEIKKDNSKYLNNLADFYLDLGKGEKAKKILDYIPEIVFIGAESKPYEATLDKFEKSKFEKPHNKYDIRGYGEIQFSKKDKLLIRQLANDVGVNNLEKIIGESKDPVKLKYSLEDYVISRDLKNIALTLFNKCDRKEIKNLQDLNENLVQNNIQVDRFTLASLDKTLSKKYVVCDSENQKTRELDSVLLMTRKFSIKEISDFEKNLNKLSKGEFDYIKVRNFNDVYDNDEIDLNTFAKKYAHLAKMSSNVFLEHLKRSLDKYPEINSIVLEDSCMLSKVISTLKFNFNPEESLERITPAMKLLASNKSYAKIKKSALKELAQIRESKLNF